jgi:hypothetical protein
MREVIMLCAIGMLLASSLGAAEETLFSARAKLDLGVDQGQNFGTLFEVTDEAGRVIMGVGFPGVFNSFSRNDRYQLQAYVRPSQLPEARWETWPKPYSELSGSYLFNFDGGIYAVGSGRALQAFKAGSRQWAPAEVLTGGNVNFGDGVMRIGNGVLEFQGSQAVYQGQVVLPRPAEGVYRNFYYAAGQLFVYYHKPGDGGFNRVAAIPWQPGDAQADLSRMKAVDTVYGGEVPFAWGQLNHEVLTVSNNGGIYVFDGQQWRVIREADNTVSYQVYSAINMNDELWLAQYPSGNLFVYDGHEVRHLAGEPPVMPGVSTSSREAQSTMFYGGELYVGVWPWAEFWRLDRDTNEWVLVKRMFTEPPLTAELTHPYEAEVAAYNKANDASIVVNTWGQRLTSMASWNDSLVLATSSKGVNGLDPNLAFLTDEVFAQYGHVERYTLPGNISAPIKAVAGPTELRCVLTTERLRLEQDGQLLAETALPAGLVADLKPAKIVWGRGLYGRLNGKLSNREVSPRPGAGR